MSKEGYPQHDARIPQDPIAVPPPKQILPIFNEPPPYNGPAYGATNPTIIEDDQTDFDQSIANIFCFGAFNDKVSGVVYNNLTGNFPFMSLDGSVCFLYYITMKQTRSWQRQSLAWMTKGNSMHTKLTSRC
jgi:hypothetical protein